MSEVYCVCKKPNTRQTAFARANKFACPDCGRTLNPDPSAETNPQRTNTELTGRPLSPDSYPSTLSALRSERGFTPLPSRPQTNNQQPELNKTKTQTSSQWSTPPLVRHPPQAQTRTPPRVIKRTPESSAHRPRKHNLGQTRRRLWRTPNTSPTTPVSL